MSKPLPHTPQSRVLLEKVWRELGENRVEERWVRDSGGWLGYQERGKIVVSPLNMVQTLLHELLHAAFPNLTETGIARKTTALWTRMTDEEAMRIWEAYNAKCIRIRRPVSSQED